MNISHPRVFLLLIMLSNIAATKPFIPEHDEQVIETLPQSIFQLESRQKIKQLRSQVKNKPNDWSSANQLAQHYINLAQTQADPRYMGYAQAILKPWWQSDQPPIPALIMRAVISQNAHDFNNANADLDRVLKQQPRHSQAHLIKATIATVQGRYQTAIKHCQQLLRRSSMLLGLICQSTPASLSGYAVKSYHLLHKILLATPQQSEQQRVWAWTSLAEIAWRLGQFNAAEQHFQTALQIAPNDYYLLRVYADFLLHQQRPLAVITLLNSETKNDSLLLRLALANQTINSPKLNAQIMRLQQGFNANRQRGSALHKGDEARFMLQLMRQPQAALHLARQNWQVQRESADTYILLQTAIAADDHVIIQQTIDWLEQQGTTDVLVQQILATRTESDHEI